VKKAFFASAVMAALLISAAAVISDSQMPQQSFLQSAPS
jgi:hypothetical protein